MCLISNHFFPKKAKEDIVCYKVLLHCHGNFVTPHQLMWINNSDVKSGKCLVPREKFRFPRQVPYGNVFIFEESNKWRIEKGFIHTFQLLKKAKCMPRERGVNFAIFECVIPKGTWYYSDKNDAYASRKIIFKKQIS